MQKGRLNKKSIFGIIKTYHAKKRQIERNITDLQLINILQNGEFEDCSEHEVVITLHGYHVYLSHDLEKIITVTAPDKHPSSIKVLNTKDAKELKKEIQQIKKEETNHKNKEMTFDDYMKTKFK